MKLTKSKLKRLIKEEVKKVLSEEEKFEYDPWFKPKKSTCLPPTHRELQRLEKELKQKRQIDPRHESPCLSEDYIARLTDLHDRARCGKWPIPLMYDFIHLKRDVRGYVKEHCPKQSRNIPWGQEEG